MAFVILGVLLILMNMVGFGPPAAWNWEFFGDLWKFVAPFLLAVAWWGWSEASGRDKRREMEKMEEKKHNRRKQNLEALGLDHRARRKGKS